MQLIWKVAMEVYFRLIFLFSKNYVVELRVLICNARVGGFCCLIMFLELEFSNF